MLTRGHGIRRSFDRIVILLSALLLVLSADRSLAQDTGDLIQFSGVVLTSDSIQPVPFAHIIDITTGYGTISGYNGYFSFVAGKSDTIVFSAMGFKKQEFIIPDSITGDRYTIIHVMTSDTIFLSETVIYPWPSREQFREAFLNLEIPDDNYEIAMKNLARSEMARRAEAMPMDASMNYRHYIDQTISKYYYAGQTQPITLLNPFAWAEFIKAWKEGRFKKKD